MLVTKQLTAPTDLYSCCCFFYGCRQLWLSILIFWVNYPF